jgi:molybdopterin synthase catalytic subunit
MTMPAWVTDGPFEPWAVLAEFDAARRARAASGAAATFIGYMRDANEGSGVAAMFLEHYPAMTARYLERLCAETAARWPVSECLAVHRVGEIRPGEAIVLTAAWSAHREAAFAACRYLIEELKHRAPLWKRETLTGGAARWVERNTPAAP